MFLKGWLDDRQEELEARVPEDAVHSLLDFAVDQGMSDLFFLTGEHHLQVAASTTVSVMCLHMIVLLWATGPSPAAGEASAAPAGLLPPGANAASQRRNTTTPCRRAAAHKSPQGSEDPRHST